MKYTQEVQLMLLRYSRSHLFSLGTDVLRLPAQGCETTSSASCACDIRLVLGTGPD